MATLKSTVERQFSQVAGNYRTSAVHAAGEDLARMVESVRLTGREHILDAGSGAGHTAMALAPFVAAVTSVDLSDAMLEQGRQLAEERGVSNVSFVRGDVEQLDFDDDAFDLITTRYSAHHWPHPHRALLEFRRVLRPDGYLLLSDIVSYADFVLDTHLQTIELLRDPSHVRDHRAEEWLAMLERAGFRAEIVFTWTLRLEFGSWVERMATPPEAVDMIRRLFDGAPAEVRTAMQVENDHSFAIPGALIKSW